MPASRKLPPAPVPDPSPSETASLEDWVSELCKIPPSALPTIRSLPLLPDGSGRMFHSRAELDAFSQSSELPGHAVQKARPAYGRALPPTPVAANAVQPSVTPTTLPDRREKPLPPLPPSDAFPLAEELTSQYWAANRGRLAKTRKTGMGQALRDLEALNALVRWDQLSLISPKPFSLREWQRRFEAAKAQCAAAGRFFAQVERIQQLALGIRNSWHAIGPEKALCDRIIQRSEEILSSSFRRITETSLAQQYERAIQARRQTLGSLHAKVPSLVTACLTALKTVRSDAEWTRGAGIPTLSRNITQIIGNAQPLAEAGFDVLVDIPRCMDLFRRLTPYANGGAPSSIDGRGFAFHHANLMGILLDMDRNPIRVG
jgi:hypothetical protein